MAAANLHTLDSDILYELLITCSELVSLKRLILTHPILYHVFNRRRRLILKAVFKTQHDVRQSRRPWAELSGTDQYIRRLDSISAIDRVALREALWPQIGRRMLPQVRKWATALLACYHQAGLENDAITFARKAIDIVRSEPLSCTFEERTLLKAVIRTYKTAKLPGEAMELEEFVLPQIHPRLVAHSGADTAVMPRHRINGRQKNPRLLAYSNWAKQLINTYSDNGHNQKALSLQLHCWELYKDEFGPESEVALDWARSIV
jgi:hypothetical protein